MSFAFRRIGLAALAAALGTLPLPASLLAEDLPQLTTVTQYGITWTFDHAVPVGQFVNGDYYVVGPVTVVGIDPLPADGRHGSVLNLPTNGRAGFDDRTPGGRFDPAQFRSPPIALAPGDSLISSISVDEQYTIPRMLRPSSTAASPVETVAVLTCMAERPPADAFRPAYCDTSNRIYRAGNLRRELLPSVPRTHGTEEWATDNVLWRVDLARWDVTALENWVRVFQRPWIDTVYDGFACPVRNMPQYGREVARATGHATLLLCCDYTAAEKEPLLVNLVQVGIDLWGAIEAGHGGWGAHGGHGNGRKLPIVFAGFMLGDPDMMDPYARHPDLLLSEDMQTMYDACWTGADVVFAGHMGADGHPSYPDWGAYEHLNPRDWPGTTGESYRRCCTSIAWVGQAMALKLLHAEGVWNHPSFFDYVERWMTEDDSEHVQIILQETGQDYSASWARQRQCWDRFIEEMYAAYWNDVPPAPGMSWSALATHGPAGEQAIALTDGAIEPRLGGLAAIRVTFTAAVDPATVDTGALAIVGDASGDLADRVDGVTLDETATVLTAVLSPALADADRYTLAVTDAVRMPGGTPVGGDRDVVVGVLPGDVDGSGAIDAADLVAVREAAGEDLSDGHQRADVDRSGEITGADRVIVRARLGTTLP